MAASTSLQRNMTDRIHQATRIRIHQATRIQRLWRGVLGRRAWTELLLASALDVLQRPSKDELDLEVAPQRHTHRHTSSPSPTLEEAREMAREAAGSMRSPGPATGARADAADDVGAGAAADRHSTGSGDSLRTPPDAARHAEDACRTSALLGERQFTAEMASEMSIDELRELMGVLSRLTVNRNGVLISLLQKRDDLLHEKFVLSAPGRPTRHAQPATPSPPCPPLPALAATLGPVRECRPWAHRASRGRAGPLTAWSVPRAPAESRVRASCLPGQRAARTFGSVPPALPAPPTQDVPRAARAAAARAGGQLARAPRPPRR